MYVPCRCGGVDFLEFVAKDGAITGVVRHRCHRCGAGLLSAKVIINAEVLSPGVSPVWGEPTGVGVSVKP